MTVSGVTRGVRARWRRRLLAGSAGVAINGGLLVGLSLIPAAPILVEPSAVEVVRRGGRPGSARVRSPASIQAGTTIGDTVATEPIASAAPRGPHRGRAWV